MMTRWYASGEGKTTGRHENLYATEYAQEHPQYIVHASDHHTQSPFVHLNNIVSEDNGLSTSAGEHLFVV
jgi:hypothetical protein